MSEDKAAEVAERVREGLESYGHGDVSAAIQAWREALAIDPSDEQARDYLATADRRKRPRPSQKPGDEAAWALLREARVLLGEKEFAAAWNLLSARNNEEAPLEYELVGDLLRVQLFRSYRGELGPLSRVPRLAGGAAALEGFNLPPAAGFLVSQMDGHTSIEDLLTLSGLDPFEVLHAVKGLREAGLVELV